MNLNVLIDSLMVYAQENLLLDDMDIIFSRNRIIQRLNITDYEEYDINPEMVEGMQSPFQLLNQISSHFVEKGEITEQEREALEVEIMTLLIKRPSEISDMFGDLFHQGKTVKALLWLSDYNHKSGFIKPQNILKHWEAKGTKGKIEVFIARNTFVDLGKYPGCSKCAEVDGFGKYRTMRRAALELDSDSFFWQFEENPYATGLGYAIDATHTPATLNEKSLNRMFDFLSIPNYFIAMEPTKGHGYFTGAMKLLPAHKAPDLRKFKSLEYPYISITEVDWYTNVLRLSCTNREKLIEFVLKLTAAFEQAGEGNVASISIRKAEKYIVELFLGNSKLSVGEKCTNLFASSPDFLARMGIVVLDESLNEDIKQMDMYLTKESKFNDALLTGSMTKHKAMISKMLKEIGSAKISTIESQIDIKEEINNICESALIDMRVYPKTQEGEDAFVEFLLGQGIK